MAKRLKKEKVSVDVINFGEEVFFQTHTQPPEYFLPSLHCCVVHVLTLIHSHPCRR